MSLKNLSVLGTPFGGHLGVAGGGDHGPRRQLGSSGGQKTNLIYASVLHLGHNSPACTCIKDSRLLMNQFTFSICLKKEKLEKKNKTKQNKQVYFIVAFWIRKKGGGGVICRHPHSVF